MGRVAALPAQDGRRLPHEDLWRFVLTADAAAVLSAPLVYSLIIPVILLDVWVSAYQAICFRAWGIVRVRRRDYFLIDRHRLPYLNTVQKAHCVYCGYVNGLFAYVREVASRTEQYWCPIRHSRRVRGAHPASRKFAPYGDATAYRTRQARLRAGLKR